jgi:putative tryptophan/tyrosine transport system substrate-binding protein
MNRREFVGLVGGAAAWTARPISEAAAQPIPVLGYATNRNADQQRLDAFRRGLSELGYFDGKNLRIDFREGVLDADYQQITMEFVAAKVAIILASNAPAAMAAGRATKAIPIVMLAVNDPVGLGLVRSLEHPGANVTGTTMYAPQLVGERLRILKSIVPGLDRIAMVFNGNNPNNATQLEHVRSEARAMGIEVVAIDLRKAEDVGPAFDRAVALGAKALVNGVDSLINSLRVALAAEADKYKLPAIYTDVEYVTAGGLMSLGPGHLEGFYRAAKYVDQILHGANPAELPIAGATQFTLSVSRSELAKLGLTIPPEAISRVNEWID